MTQPIMTYEEAKHILLTQGYSCKTLARIIGAEVIPEVCSSRGEAKVTLQQHGMYEQVVQWLVRGLTEADPFERRLAAHIIGLLGAVEAAEALRAVCTGDANEQVQQEAKTSMEWLAKSMIEAPDGGQLLQ